MTIPRLPTTRRAGLLAATIGITSLLVASCATRDAVVDAKQHQYEGAYIDAGGINTFYVHGGSGAPPVVLVHGLGASTFSFRHNIVPLAEHFSVYALDLKGFGATDKPLVGYGLDELRDHLSWFLDAVGLDRAVLVGNSMGGEVAIRLALQQPERIEGLVLIDSAGFLRWTDTPLEGRVVTVAPGVGELLTAPLPLQQQLSRRVMARYLLDVYYDPAHVTREVVNGYYLPLARAGGSRGFLSRMRAHDWGGEADRIKDITAPTLVLWGEEDKLIPVSHAEKFREALPHARVIIYPECGHHPHAERADEVNDEIVRFIHSLS